MLWSSMMLILAHLPGAEVEWRPFPDLVADCPYGNLGFYRGMIHESNEMVRRGVLSPLEKGRNPAVASLNRRFEASIRLFASDELDGAKFWDRETGDSGIFVGGAEALRELEKAIPPEEDFFSQRGGGSDYPVFLSNQGFAFAAFDISRYRVYVSTTDTLLQDGKKAKKWNLVNWQELHDTGYTKFLSRRDVFVSAGASAADVVILNEVIYSNGWRSEDRGRHWSFVGGGPSRESNESGSDTMFHFKDAKLTVSVNSGKSWEFVRTVDTQIKSIRFSRGVLWGFGFDQKDAVIYAGYDLGKTWIQTFRATVPLLTTKENVANGVLDNGEFCVALTQDEYGCVPLGGKDWVRRKNSLPIDRVNKVRALGDDIYVMHSQCGENELIKQVGSGWVKMDSGVFDFELWQSELVILDESSDGGYVNASSSNQRVNGVMNLWRYNGVDLKDTLWRYYSYSHCEVVNRGGTLYCYPIGDRLDQTFSGELQIQRAYAVNGPTGDSLYGFKSQDGSDGSIAWVAVKSMDPVIPRIDSSKFRLEGAGKLMARVDASSVQRTLKNSTMVIHGDKLSVFGKPNEEYRVESVDVSGKMIFHVGGQIPAEGVQKIRIPHRRGIQIIRIHQGGVSKVLPWVL